MCQNSAVRVRWGGLLILSSAAILAGCAADADPNLLDVSATDFAAHSTPARLAAAGTVTIGITGNDVDESNVPVGFEAEVGRMIAGALGVADHQISWVQTDSLNHERLIEDGHVDLVIAAMPMTGRSREIVDFAGPYYTGRVATLSASTETDVRRVCATAEISHLVTSPEGVGTLRDCVDQLTDGTVDAVLGPDLALAPEVGPHFTLGDADLGSLSYGIGMVKADDELRSFVADVLATVAEDGRWASAWASTLEPVLGPAEPPPIDRD
jgi:glutamate transport system substrate-binding protein